MTTDKSTWFRDDTRNGDSDFSYIFFPSGRSMTLYFLVFIQRSFELGRIVKGHNWMFDKTWGKEAVRRFFVYPIGP